MTWCNDVNIRDVLDRLGVEYFRKTGNEYGIYQDGKKTDGWAFNTDQNIVKDFAGKWRLEGWPFQVVKMREKLDDKDVFVWFENNFPMFKPTNENYKKPVLSIWKWLSPCTEMQIEYLKGRGIDYAKVEHLVRDYKGWIGCLVYENGIPKGLNARTLSKDHRRRFMALAGYPTKGVYMDKLDDQKSYVIVVEGLIDFLTLRQYETNVIGLKSSESWMEYVEKLTEKYEVIVVYDNDEAWRKAKDKVKFKHKFFDRGCMEGLEAKDVNDIHNHWWELTLEFILENTIQESIIMKTIEKVRHRQKIIAEKWMLWDPWPYKFYEEHTSGIVRWKVYGICAFSNTGKSKFAYSHCARFLKQWLTCLYVSVEESEVDIFLNVFCTYERVSIKDSHKVTIQPSKYQNLICSDEARTTEEIDGMVKMYRPDVVFIDYAQGLSAKWSWSYEKHSNIAAGIQEIAIWNNVTVFCLHQMANNMLNELKNWLSEVDIVHMKGAGDYFARNDVIMAMSREDDELYMKIVKNKLGRRGGTYHLDVRWQWNEFILSEHKDEFSAKF